MTLPATDGAFGQTFSQSLQDPFVGHTVAAFAWACGLLSFPLVLLATKRRPMAPTIAFVFGVTLAMVVATTLVSHPFVAALSGMVTLTLTCAYCWRSPIVPQ